MVLALQPMKGSVLPHVFFRHVGAAGCGRPVPRGSSRRMQFAALQNTHAAKWLEPAYMLHAATAKRVIFDLYRFIYLYTADTPKPFAEKSSLKRLLVARSSLSCAATRHPGRHTRHNKRRTRHTCASLSSPKEERPTRHQRWWPMHQPLPLIPRLLSTQYRPPRAR